MARMPVSLGEHAQTERIMDLDRIREIIDLITESGVSEIEVEEEGLRIVVRKHAPTVAAMPAPMEVHHVSPPSNNTPATAAVETPPASTGTSVRAPIVGTFYRSPTPDSDPFVRIGDSVKPGDILCIIEAMKLMNEIECEVEGTVSEVLVEDANPIEFDQPLFIIE
jgi:acetyl-CoA carboxylase biotin carboxyl carrier protein